MTRHDTEDGQAMATTPADGRPVDDPEGTVRDPDGLRDDRPSYRPMPTRKTTSEDRVAATADLATRLLAMGLVPRAIRVTDDGVEVDVAAYSPPGAEGKGDAGTGRRPRNYYEVADQARRGDR